MLCHYGSFREGWWYKNIIFSIINKFTMQCENSEGICYLYCTLSAEI